jgi:glycosyltransferase involved in cell wall biosynthesis
VTSEYPPYGSGIANVVLALEKRLAKRGQFIKVLSRKGANYNISTSFDKFPGLAGLLPFWQQATKYIANNASNYDVTWLHSPILYKTTDLRNVKILFSNHTTYFGFYQAYKRSGFTSLLPYYYLMSNLEGRMFRDLSKHNDAVITAVSPSVAEEVSNNGLGFLPEVVPNGIDSNVKIPLTKQLARESLAKGYSIALKADDIVFLYLGRITEQKMPFKLLEYFRAVNQAIPNAVLVICGKGNLLSKLKKEVRSNENIHLIGFASPENLGLLFKASDLFISLSCYEGLPLSALEAARHGLPLILSDIPPHRWLLTSKIGRGIIISDFEHGFKDIEKLSLSNVDLPYNGDYDWEVIIDEYLRLMERI